MNRKQAEGYIAEKYGVAPEYPWLSSPMHGVFRHESNRKWFAIIMRVSGTKLGLESDENIDVMNVKCDNIVIGSLLGQSGFFPAYHMNKSHWISIALDGSAEEETVKWLIDMSFSATAEKTRRKTVKKRETRVQRIARMEEYFDTLCKAVEKDAESVKRDTALRSVFEELTAYYENGQWLADYEADEQGMLPSGLRRGVLSQDGLYNLLSEIADKER
ncbi:MAG: DUF4298 domain-containing protein [Ruminococcus sp.]|nr:DUF4298 domain-containing protein [Ruminococcus sp.]